MIIKCVDVYKRKTVHCHFDRLEEVHFRHYVVMRLHACTLAKRCKSVLNTNSAGFNYGLYGGRLSIRIPNSWSKFSFRPTLSLII